jgi:hypothetical protein
MKQNKSPNNNNNGGKPKQQGKGNPKSSQLFSKAAVAAPVAKDVRVKTYLRVLPGRKGYPGSMRLQGCDLLQAVKVPPSGTSEVPGRAYCEVYLNPKEFEGTRLGKFAQLYEKYIFTNVRFIFQPCKGSSQDGTIGIAYDRDIDDPTPPPTTQGLRQFRAWQGTEVGRVWDPIVVEAKLLAPETGFYCDTHGSEDRTAFQGQVYVFCEVPTGLAVNTQIGDLYMEYDLDLFIPALDDDLPTTSYGNAGTTVMTLTDIFRPGAQGLAGAQIDPLASLDAYPPYGLNSAGISQIFLEEGVHRLNLKAAQSGAGILSLQPGPGPTMIPRDPVQSQGQQPQWASLFNAASNAANNWAGVDWLFNIPKGGVDITAAPGTFTASNAAWSMNIQKVSELMAPEQFTNFAASLFT